MALIPGSRLGPYEILSLLGTGGMGEVYRARDPRLDREVAIKVLPDAGTASAQTLERFQREARAASALNHPHICTIYEVGTDPPFIAMEMLDGETLERRLGRGAIAFPAARGTSPPPSRMRSTPRTARGIVHETSSRRTSSSRPRGPKILDFGLAKATSDPQPPMPRTRSRVRVRGC